MICRDARKAIMEAEVSVLRGEGDHALAAHIRECPKCREQATAILDGEAQLARSMGGVLPLPDLDEIIRQAETAGEEEVLHLPGRRSRKRFARMGLALVPLAAAAALTALFLGRPPALPGPEYKVAAADVGLDVEVPEGRNVAVMETNNPEITVLWLF